MKRKKKEMKKNMMMINDHSYLYLLLPMFCLNYVSYLVVVLNNVLLLNYMFESCDIFLCFYLYCIFAI